MLQALHKEQKSVSFLSKETYKALLLTSRSTAACIRYLLKEKQFKYVLA